MVLMKNTVSSLIDLFFFSSLVPIKWKQKKKGKT
jgi:hypothetical protein